MTVLPVASPAHQSGELVPGATLDDLSTAALRRTVGDQTRYIDTLLRQLQRLTTRERELRGVLQSIHEQAAERDRETVWLKEKCAEAEQAAIAHDEAVRWLQEHLAESEKAVNWLRERCAEAEKAVDWLREKRAEAEQAAQLREESLHQLRENLAEKESALTRQAERAHELEDQVRELTAENEVIKASRAWRLGGRARSLWDATTGLSRR